MSSEGRKMPQIVAALAATIGAYSLGTGLGWTSPVLPYLKLPPFSFSGQQLSWISSIFILACSVSGIVTGFSMSKIGRKWTMIIMTVPLIIGWILLTIPKPQDYDEAWIFYLGRILTGLGGGAFALASPIYINEIAEASIRGALGTLMQFMLTVGNLWDNGVGSLFGENWGIFTGLMIIFPVMLGVAMFFMPESPYYLVSRNREEAARKSLVWLRGKNYDVDEELDTLKATVQTEKEIGSISLKELLTVNVYVKPFAIMMTLMFLQQYSGINAVLLYLQDIFIKAGADIDPGLQATIVSLVQVLATGGSIFIVDRFGRKILLILSDAIMALSILALGIYFYLDENKYEDCGGLYSSSTTTAASRADNSTSTLLPPLATTECVPNLDGTDLDTLDAIGWLPLVSLMIYIFAFSIGFGPVPWMVNSEFFSLESRGLASSICATFSWFFGFLVTKFEEDIEDGINTSGAYFMYAAVCAVGTVFVIFVVPETKGRSPDDIKCYFKHGKFPKKGEKFDSEEMVTEEK